VTLEELSDQSDTGIEYASGILYALSLGIKIYGKIPPWIMRITWYPDQVHPNLLSGVRSLLSTVGTKITDKGELEAIDDDA